MANDLLLLIEKAKIIPYNQGENFKCFNNKQIQIEGVLQIDLRSGSCNAPDCQILLVENKTHNIMGRDTLRKPGITCKQYKNSGKKILHITDTTTESNIMKWILKKHPNLCTRLEKSKNHMAKPTMKENFIPVQQKEERVPLHFLEKVETQKIESRQKNNQIKKMFW